MFVLVGDDLRETSASPAERAALYEVAARIPGVELVGSVTDPAGRTGVAVAMTDTTNHMRQTLIFDPQTAQLLAEEQTVVAGNVFGWPAGALVGRTIYLVHEVVSSNTAVPAPSLFSVRHVDCGAPALSCGSAGPSVQPFWRRVAVNATGRARLRTRRRYRLRGCRPGRRPRCASRRRLRRVRGRGAAG
jgi:hypothetical protein